MKVNLLLAAVFLSIIIYANINEIHGIVGLTKKDNGPGCVCHNFSPTDSVIVWIEGPDSLLKNSSAQYRIKMTGGPAVAGGFNVASYFGMIDSVDSLTRTIAGELTHSFPNLFVNDTVQWEFLYTAPDSIVADTLYSVANSVNLDSIPTNLDQWNFGENFLVTVYDNPVSVQNEELTPDQFVLYQNYPNPFNPTTIIRFQISNFGFVNLKVYDLLGNEVAILVNENKPAGEYEVEFSSDGLSSGIYFYKLETKNFSAIKKMILLR